MIDCYRAYCKKCRAHVSDMLESYPLCHRELQVHGQIRKALAVFVDSLRRTILSS